MPLDVVAELYRFFKEERAKHERRPSVYWVTDLVSCSLKSRFSQEYPELELAQFFNPTLVQGALLHKGLEAVLKELLEARGAKVGVEVEASVEVDLSSALPSAGRAVLRGRADLVVELGDERVGVEVKSARGDALLPLDHHVDQCRIYNFLFNFNYTCLVYVTPERIAQYEVVERGNVEELARRILEPKAPRYSWECRYCPYSVVCPSKVR